MPHLVSHLWPQGATRIQGQERPLDECGSPYTLVELAQEVAGNYSQLRSTIRGVALGSAAHKAIRRGVPPAQEA